MQDAGRLGAFPPDSNTPSQAVAVPLVGPTSSGPSCNSPRMDQAQYHSLPLKPTPPLPLWTVRNCRARFPCLPSPTRICLGYRTRSTTPQKPKLKLIIHTQSRGLHLQTPPSPRRRVGTKLFTPPTRWWISQGFASGHPHIIVSTPGLPSPARRRAGGAVTMSM